MKTEDLSLLISAGKTEKEEFVEHLILMKKERQSLKNGNDHIIYTALKQENIPFLQAFNEVYPDYLNFETPITNLQPRSTSAYYAIENMLGTKNEKLENAIYSLIKNDFFTKKSYGNLNFYERDESYINSNARFNNYVFTGAKYKNINFILPFIDQMSIYNKNNSLNSFAKLFFNLLMKKTTIEQFEYIIDQFVHCEHLIENPIYTQQTKEKIKSIQSNLFKDQNILYAFHLIVSGSINKNNTKDQIKKMDFLAQVNPEIISKLFEAEREYSSVFDIASHLSKSRTPNNPVLNLAILKGQEPIIDWFIRKGYVLCSDEILKIASNEKIFTSLKEKYPDSFKDFKSDGVSALMPVFDSYFANRLKTNTRNLDSFLSNLENSEKQKLFEEYKDKIPVYHYLKNSPASLDDDGMNSVDFAILNEHIESTLILFKHGFPFNGIQRLKIGEHISKFVNQTDFCFDFEILKPQFIDFLNSLPVVEQKIIIQKNTSCALLIDEVKNIVKNIDFSKEEILSMLGREDFIRDYLLLHNDYQDFSKEPIIQGLIKYYSCEKDMSSVYCKSKIETEILRENIKALMNFDPSYNDNFLKAFRNISKEMQIFIEKISLGNLINKEKIVSKNANRI